MFYNLGASFFLKLKVDYSNSLGVKSQIFFQVLMQPTFHHHPVPAECFPA